MTSKPSPPETKKLTRRRFLRWGLRATAGVMLTGTATTAYGFWEASQIRIRRREISLPTLPAAFTGKTIAVLGDFHNGPFVSMDFIRQAVTIAQELRADLYALVGDFAHKGTHTTEQLPPCLEALAKLEAPLGVYAVPGNHDMQNQGQVYRDVIRDMRLTDVTNCSVKVTVAGESIWLAGVDDLWWGKPNLKAALADVPEAATTILLAHNPDFAETQPDDRVSLMLSGHTHGGQVYLPGIGTGGLPSRYGDKYRGGLVAGPKSPVFVTRGLGEAGVPLRLNCPPEINLLTLVPAL
jgi:uncharacterized protein